MGSRCCRALAAVLVIAGILLPALAIAGWLNLGKVLDASGPPAPADAIMVMGGEGTRFTRTRYAVALYSQGLAPQVVMSGGTLADVGVACSSTLLSTEEARALGLPPSALVLAPEAQSTWDEASNLRVLAAEQGWHSLLLVTDRFHTRRSLQTLRAALPGVQISAAAPDDPLYDPARWWSNERSLTFVVNELLKLGLYWLHYGIRPWG